MWLDREEGQLLIVINYNYMSFDKERGIKLEDIFV